MKPIGAIEAQIVDQLSVFSVAGAGGEEIRLDDGFVVSEKLEVDLVLRFVAFEGRKVEVLPVGQRMREEKVP